MVSNFLPFSFKYNKRSRFDSLVTLGNGLEYLIWYALASYSDLRLHRDGIIDVSLMKLDSSIL